MNQFISEEERNRNLERNRLNCLINCAKDGIIALNSLINRCQKELEELERK